MNNVTVSGQIGKIKRFDNDYGPTFIFDVSDSFKKKDGTYQNWKYKVTFFGKRGATIEQYFEEGAPIIISGTIRGIDESVSKTTGDTFLKIAITATDFSFIPKKFEPNNERRGSSVPAADDLASEEIPF